MSGDRFRPPASRLATRYDGLLRTAQQIIRSPSVAQFCIGITGAPTTRKAAYARWCRSYRANLDGWVILDWDRSPDQVVHAEHWLFHQLRSHPKHTNTENVEYFPNVNRRFERQVLYIAWWSPPFDPTIPPPRPGRRG